jgi:hypothetical protein
VRSKLEAVTSKLTTLFKKQRALAEEEEDHINTVSTEVFIASLVPGEEVAGGHGVVVHEVQLNRKQEAQKAMMLSKKVAALTKSLGIALCHTRLCYMSYVVCILMPFSYPTAMLLSFNAFSGLLEQKTRSTTRQWTGDKELHAAEMKRKEAELHEMEIRLQV